MSSKTIIENMCKFFCSFFHLNKKNFMNISVFKTVFIKICFFNFFFLNRLEKIISHAPVRVDDYEQRYLTNL